MNWTSDPVAVHGNYTIRVKATGSTFYKSVELDQSAELPSWLERSAEPIGSASEPVDSPTADYAEPELIPEPAPEPEPADATDPDFEPDAPDEPERQSLGDPEE